MKSIQQLQKFIRGNEPMFFRLITESNQLYTSFKIPKKKKGEYRLIEAPFKSLKKIQNNIKTHFTYCSVNNIG